MLRNKFSISNEYPKVIQAGQMAFIFGILITRMMENAYVSDLFMDVLGESGKVHFMEGFLDGLGMVLIILSIVLNLRGLSQYRTNLYLS